MKATISVMGLYNYDNSLFANMELPNGVDKETLVYNLVLELAELEVIYPHFDVLKMSIGMWSKKELPVWEKLYATTQFEYDPISNYDRKEEWTEKETRDLKNSNNQTRNLTVTSSFNATETNSGADTTTEKVVGFNSEAETLKNKNSIEHGLQTTGKNSGTGTDNGSVNNSGTDTGTVDNIRKGRAYGNIGVTTTQQMIEQERETVKFNIIDYIIESFKNRFCILIY